MLYFWSGCRRNLKLITSGLIISFLKLSKQSVLSVQTLLINEQNYIRSILYCSRFIICWGFYKLAWKAIRECTIFFTKNAPNNTLYVIVWTLPSSVGLFATSAPLRLQCEPAWYLNPCLFCYTISFVREGRLTGIKVISWLRYLWAFFNRTNRGSAYTCREDRRLRSSRHVQTDPQPILTFPLRGS